MALSMEKVAIVFLMALPIKVTSNMMFSKEKAFSPSLLASIEDRSTREGWKEEAFLNGKMVLSTKDSIETIENMGEASIYLLRVNNMKEIGKMGFDKEVAISPMSWAKSRAINGVMGKFRMSESSK